MQKIINELNFNEQDHFNNLFNGMVSANLIKDSKAFFKDKANKNKTKYFNLIRNQYNFNSIIDVSFIRNKQNFIQSARLRLDSMTDRQFTEFMDSETLQNDYAMLVPDIIIDITGFAGLLRREPTRVRLNISYNLYFFPEFIEFINEDIKEIIKGTDIPYNKKYFEVGTSNGVNFLGSILCAYIYSFPDQYQELFKDCGYESILHLLPMALTCYKKKYDVLGSDEAVYKYLNIWLSNYCTFDENIKNYTLPWVQNR